jgi:hypothetical protein
VDLNRDGEFVGTNDLMIHNFFADSTNVPGNGFIETIGNLSGTDILNWTFLLIFLEVTVAILSLGKMQPTIR